MYFGALPGARKGRAFCCGSGFPAAILFPMASRLESRSHKKKY